jgi:hypothetical protein
MEDLRADGAGDSHNLPCGLALPENDFRGTLPRQTLQIDVGEPDFHPHLANEYTTTNFPAQEVSGKQAYPPFSTRKFGIA